MSRIPRGLMDTYNYYHVCARGNNDQSIFTDDSDRLRYVLLIEKYRQLNNLKCYAYCLMSNHVHLLYFVRNILTLSKTLHNMHCAYAMYFNLRHKRKGHLFQDRYVSWIVKNDSHLLTAKKYIEENPVKAGICQLPGAYKWSSAGRDEPFVTLSPIDNYEEPSLNILDRKF